MKSLDEKASDTSNELESKLFPLRIKLWMSWKHSYTCGAFDGFKSGYSQGYSDAIEYLNKFVCYSNIDKRIDCNCINDANGAADFLVKRGKEKGII